MKMKKAFSVGVLGVYAVLSGSPMTGGSAQAQANFGPCGSSKTPCSPSQEPAGLHCYCGTERFYMTELVTLGGQPVLYLGTNRLSLASLNRGEPTRYSEGIQLYSNRMPTRMVNISTGDAKLASALSRGYTIDKIENTPNGKVATITFRR